MIIIFNWIRSNLLASKLDVLLSLLGAYFIYLVTSIFLTFVFTSDWTLIEVNRKILLLGLFPDDQIWRIWVLFAISSILISATLSYTYRFNIKTAIFYVLLVLTTFLIFTTLKLLPVILSILGFALLVYLLVLRFKFVYKKLILRVVLTGWVIFIPAMFLI